MDKSAVDRLTVEHLPMALRFARQLTHNPHDAEEVVQEALCQVLRHWSSFRGDASFRTWFLKIVVNVDRDRRRRQRKVLPLPSQDVASRAISPTVAAELNELHAKIRAAIAALPERQREVASLSFGEGLTPREVAAVLDITEANAHTCLHLARKRIAQEIGMQVVRREVP
jgi:RNA polymerase sigma-70 factor, ECF subfamily